MPTAKNKLPTFGSTANVDDAIVQNTSTLKDTGFQANTLIESAQVNTYFKMFVNALNGLIDATYNTSAGQANISAISTADEWKTYLTNGLAKIINGTRVKNADQATSASKLDTARTIELTGDVSGSGTFDGSQKTTIEVDVKNAAALDSKNIGDATHPVYFDADGKPVKITTVERAQKLPAKAIGSATHPVYVNASGEVTPISILSTNINNSATYVEEGLFRVSALSDKADFWAYVQILDTGNVIASGIAKFSNGYIDGYISGNNIVNIKTTTDSFAVTHKVVNVVSNTSKHSTDIKIQLLHGDGHATGMLDPAPGVISMRVYELYR